MSGSDKINRSCIKSSMLCSIATRNILLFYLYARNYRSQSRLLKTRSGSIIAVYVPLTRHLNVHQNTHLFSQFNLILFLCCFNNLFTFFTTIYNRKCWRNICLPLNTYHSFQFFKQLAYSYQHCIIEIHPVVGAFRNIKDK